MHLNHSSITDHRPLLTTLLAAVFFLFLCLTPSLHATPTHYQVDLEINTQEKFILGQVLVTFSPPLSLVTLDIPDIKSRFKTASNAEKDRYILSPLPLTWQLIDISAGNTPLTTTEKDHKVIIKTKNRQPIPALTVRYRLNIPHLMGLFGYYHQYISLGAAYFPIATQVQPWSALINIHLDQAAFVVLPTGPTEKTKNVRLALQSRIPFLFISLTPPIARMPLQVNQTSLSLIHFEKRDYARFFRHFEHFLKFLTARFPLKHHFYFLESNILEMLAITQSDIFLLNRGIYHTNILLKAHHSVYLFKLFLRAYLTTYFAKKNRILDDKQLQQQINGILNDYFKQSESFWKLPFKQLAEFFDFIPFVDRYINDEQIDFKHVYLENSQSGGLDGQSPSIPNTAPTSPQAPQPQNLKQVHKVLVSPPWFDFDFQSRHLQFGQWLSVRKMHDPYDRKLSLEFKALEEMFSLSAGYNYTFPAIPVYTDYQISHQIPTRHFIATDTSPKIQTALKAGVGYSNGDDSRFSENMHAEYLQFDFTEDYVKWALSTQLYQRLARYTVLVEKVVLGKFVGKENEHYQFVLGGFKGVRGFMKNEIVAKQMVQSTTELRFPLQTNIQSNLFNSIFYQNWVGTLFLDFVNTNFFQTRLADRQNNFLGVGFGFRHDLTLFGLRRLTLCTDLAFLPMHDNRPFALYLNIGDSI